MDIVTKIISTSECYHHNHILFKTMLMMRGQELFDGRFKFEVSLLIRVGGSVKQSYESVFHTRETNNPSL